MFLHMANLVLIFGLVSFNERGVCSYDFVLNLKQDIGKFKNTEGNLTR